MNRYAFPRRTARSLMRQLAEALDGRYDAGARCVRVGAAEVRYVVRGSGSFQELSTEVDVERPAGYPLAIAVRRTGWLGRRRAAAGADAFERAFVVELAPADVGERLLDEAMRAYLVRLDGAALTTELRGDRPVVRLAVPSWLRRASEVREAIERMTALTGGIRDAFADVAGDLELRDRGAPFRPMPDDERQRAAEAERAAEVERAERLRRERDRRTGLAVAAAALAGAALSLLLGL